mmetsp:Transcript_19477/g.55816  ORF Transcript_19477/g.55816 Transcript_19477/m.55816 type:complete len:101 (-) Transcript_19477:166-468(-)
MLWVTTYRSAWCVLPLSECIQPASRPTVQSVSQKTRTLVRPENKRHRSIQPPLPSLRIPIAPLLLRSIPSSLASIIVTDNPCLSLSLTHGRPPALFPPPT